MVDENKWLMRRRGVALIRIFVCFYMMKFASFNELKYVF